VLLTTPWQLLGAATVPQAGCYVTSKPPDVFVHKLLLAMLLLLMLLALQLLLPVPLLLSVYCTSLMLHFFAASSSQQ
jgi:hypothetical protein